MSKKLTKYYPIGFSGDDFLSVRESTIYHSEYIKNRGVQLIECDKETKYMKVMEKKENDKEWNEINMDGFIQGVTIDLSDKGDRWEGNSLNNSPFGYGCIYNSENQLIYKGFVFKGMKVCFGNEFFGDAGIIEYEGEYYKNMRFGYGKLYDKKSNLLYEGEWLNNQPIELTNVTLSEEMKENDISFGVKELIIEDEYKGKYCNFILHSYPHLKSLHIGRNCFSNVNVFEISNCVELEEVFIGKCSFNRINKDSKENKNENGIFRITDCLKLKKIVFELESFGDYCGGFELKSNIELI